LVFLARSLGEEGVGVVYETGFDDVGEDWPFGAFDVEG
jgi:hypothetical protein